MPVAQGGPPPARQALLIGLPALLGVLAIVFLVTRFDRLAGGSDPTPVEVGNPVFPLGSAEDLAGEIGDTGPALLPDASGGNRDLYVQHLGDDPLTGWFAFAARPEGAERDCFVQWDADADGADGGSGDESEGAFVDSCDGTVYPADGTGLTQYAVSVDVDGDLTINLTPQPSD